MRKNAPCEALDAAGKRGGLTEMLACVKIQMNVHARSGGQTANTTRPHRTLMKGEGPWKQGHCGNAANV